MSITIGDILKVVATVVWLDGNLNQNVFNAVISGTGGPYDDADIVLDALAWATAMYANLTTDTSDQCDGTQIQVYIYDSVDDDWDEVGTGSWVWNPTSVISQLPRGVAGLINAKSLDPDVQGKKYIGGLTEGVVADGLFEAGTITILGDFADDWVTPFVGGTSGADWVPGVWSVVQKNLRAMTGATIIPVIPSYQRRRKPGVGV